MAKIPVSRDDLVVQLKKMGYNDVKAGEKGKKFVTVYITVDKDINRVRIAALQNIAAKLSAANIIAEYDSSIDRTSIKTTVGQVVVKSTETYGDGELIIFVKRTGKTGADRPGVANEILLNETINKYAKEISDKGSITLEFKGGGKTMTINSVTRSYHAGTKGAKKGGKGDVNIISSKKRYPIPISLKEENAGNWASSDSYWNETGAKILEYCLRNNLIKITKIGKNLFETNKIGRAHV